MEMLDSLGDDLQVVADHCRQTAKVSTRSTAQLDKQTFMCIVRRFVVRLKHNPRWKLHPNG